LPSAPAPMSLIRGVRRRRVPGRGRRAAGRPANRFFRRPAPTRGSQARSSMLSANVRRRIERVRARPRARSQAFVVTRDYPRKGQTRRVAEANGGSARREMSPRWVVRPLRRPGSPGQPPSSPSPKPRPRNLRAAAEPGGLASVNRPPGAAAASLSGCAPRRKRLRNLEAKAADVSRPTPAWTDLGGHGPQILGRWRVLTPVPRRASRATSPTANQPARAAPASRRAGPRARRRRSAPAAGSPLGRRTRRIHPA
jgi:hypothetical protein